MARMKLPRLPEVPPPVLRNAELRAVLTTCERDKSFYGRRDEGIIRWFLDTGIHRGELLGREVEDVALDTGRLRVTGKGSRTREVQIGDQSVRTLDRYLRARVKRPSASIPALWLGKKGPLGATGLADLVADRGSQAGLKVLCTPTSSATPTRT